MRCVVASTGACVSTRMSHSYKWDEPGGGEGSRGEGREGGEGWTCLQVQSAELDPGTPDASRARPTSGGAPACLLHSPPRATRFLCGKPRPGREVPIRFLLEPKQKHRNRNRNRNRGRCGAPAPAPRLPGDCGREPLLAAAAAGARRPSSSRQQSQKEEVLRSRRAPRFAAISGPRAAAAAAPRSPRLLLSRAPQPVPRCRLGSRGRRRCSSPARAAPLTGGETPGRLPPAAGREGGERGAVRTFRAGEWGAVGLQVPGAATRCRLRIHTPARGGRRPWSMGGGGWRLGPGAHTPAHAQRAYLARTPRRRAARPRSNPSGRPAGPLPPPSPRSCERARGAPALLLASGKPRRRGSSSSSRVLAPRSPRPREEIPPAHLPDAAGCGDPRATSAASPGLSARPQRTRTAPQSRPGASI